jgi:acyl-CoA synthetase (AMP-forming)/AMP-acid ligase II
MEGELSVIGRFKDIVIMGGNDIFPEDVKTAVNTLGGIYPGRVVAFGVEDRDYGTQSLAIAAEMKGDLAEEGAVELESAIRKPVPTTIEHRTAACSGCATAMDREKHGGKDFAAGDPGAIFAGTAVRWVVGEGSDSR